MSIATKKKIPQEKINTVEELTKLIEAFPVIGICEMQKIPSNQLQITRKNSEI